MGKVQKISEEIINHCNQRGVNRRTKEIYLRSWEKPRSLRFAINAKCAECQGFEGVFRYIKECEIKVCPLHKVRPYSNPRLKNGVTG